MGKFDSVLDDVYGKEDKKITSVLDEVYGPEVEPITMTENPPTPIADFFVGLNRGVESAGEAITAPVQRLFTAPPNQDVVVPEELDMSSMQAARDRQAMLPPSMPAEPGYVPPAGITEGLEAALPIAYQGTKKGIAGAVQALAENIPVTSFPTEPIAQYAKGVGEEAQKQIEQTIQEKQIRPGTAGAFTTDVASSMAQFLPIAGMSIISPSVAPAGLAFLATVSGGDKYQKAKEAGFGEGEALAQGIAYGAAEAIGEKIGLDYLLQAAKNPAVMSGLKTIFAQGLKQAGVEGAEEGLTQIIQNATDIVAKKVNPQTAGAAPTMLQDVPYAMGVGAAAGGVTGGGLGALQSMMAGQQQAPPQQEPEVTPADVDTTEFLKNQNNVRDDVRTAANVEKQMQEAEALRKISDEYNQLMREEAKGKPTGEEIKRQRAEKMKSQAGFVEESQIDKIEDIIREAQKAATQAQQAEAKQRKANVIEGLFNPQEEPRPVEGGRNVPYPKNDVIQEIRDAGLKTKDEVVAFFDGRHNITREGAGNLLKIAYNQPIPERTYKTPPSNPPAQPPTIDQLFKRKPQVTVGEAERLQGEAIPEGKGMTVQPTAPTNKLDQLFKREKKVEPKQIENRFDFSQETDINKLRSMLDDAVERENFQPGAESDAILKRIDELENQAIDQVSPELLNRIQESGVSPEASQKILEKAFLIKKNSIINNPKRMNDLLNEYSGIESVVKKTAKIILEDYVKQNFPKADVDGLFSNASPLSRDVQTKIIKDAQAKAKAIHGRVKDYFENPVEERMEQPSKTSPQPQQAPEVVAEDMKPQPVEQSLVETPEIETQPRPKTGPGMFGGATMQNMYEQNIEPTVKKGIDRLKAYKQNIRNADVTRDQGRVIDITEVEGKPVETEAPLRPRIGLFNLQNVYDALTRPMKQRAEDKRFKEHLDNTMAQGPRQRMEEARGLDKLSFFDRAKKAAIRLKELSTRKFPDLDDTKFPEFANKLRVLDGGKDYAEGTAGYLIHETIKDLSPEEYNVFGTSLILEDLQKGIDTGLYTNDLPFGYDAQTLAADHRAIDPAELRRAGFNDKADRIEAAVQKRNDFMREVKQEAVNNGLLPEAVMNDDRYFHHQVLQYMNMKEEGAGTGGKKDVRIGKKGYRMSRTGSLKDFNTEYAQAEFEVLSQMIEDNKKAEFLKYVESLDITPNLRAEADLQGLPKDAATLKKLMPEGYTLWQPEKGNNFYKVFTIPERIVEEIIAKGDAVDVSMDDINEALAVGAPKKTLIIPEGLVKTLDNFGRKKTTGPVGTIGKVANKIWKTSMLFMPSRVTNYMLTNFFGDADVVLAYQGKILGNLPDAMKELYANDRKNNADLEKAYKQQVIGANITEKEIASIDYNSINKPFNIMRYLKNPLNVGKDYLQKAVRMNAFRENALRYAAFKHFLSELRAGKKNIYAASDRAKIDSITNLEEKAATLARDLLGDYGNVSALGEDIAENLIPFYRWMEVNTPRYYRMLKNAPFEGGYEGAVNGGYKMLKRFVQMNIVGTILYQLYHAAIGAASGDDELQKARDVTKARGQLHSLLPNWLVGDDKKDIVRTVRTQGALSDVTETLLGTSDLFSDVVDVASGRTKFRDKMRELGWKLDNPADFFNIPPIRKYTMAALPLARTFAETVSGRAATRSLMETRPIRDRMQHFARAMALGAPYNIATDKPGPERGASDLVTYKTNLGEIAYNEITRKKFEFLRERGYPLPSGAESPAGTAYYNLKQAVKFGDKKQIRKYFKEYNQERRKLGKDTADWYDVKERIKESADPSSFMKEELWDEFRKTLNNEEKRKLKTAMRWFKETYK